MLLSAIGVCQCRPRLDSFKTINSKLLRQAGDGIGLALPSSVSTRCFDVAESNYESLVSHWFDSYEFKWKQRPIGHDASISRFVSRVFWALYTEAEQNAISQEQKNRISITDQRPKVKNRKTDSRHEYKWHERKSRLSYILRGRGSDSS